MPDPRHNDDASSVVHFVYDAIVTDANSERLKSGQLLRSRRPGVTGEGAKPIGDPVEQASGEAFQIALGGALDLNAISGHAPGAWAPS
jgi:hypothetical protein